VGKNTGEDELSAIKRISEMTLSDISNGTGLSLKASDQIRYMARMEIIAV